MIKIAVIFTTSLILTAVLFSCGGGGGSGNAIKEVFTISYNGNGAELGVAPAKQSGDEDSPQPVQANTGNLAKSGYLFDGWNTAANGSGKNYSPGSSYKGESITLYAKWAAIFNVQIITPPSPAPALNGVQRAPGVPYIRILSLTAKGRTLKNINIPSYIDGYPVGSIGSGAFQNCDTVTEWIIPNTVTTIEDNAFSGCIGLSSMTIPDSVTAIGSGAFFGCAGLGSLIMLTAAPPAIGTGALEGCTATVSVPAAGVESYKNAEGWDTYSTSIAGYSTEIYTVEFDGQGATTAPSFTSKEIIPPAVTIGELPAPPAKTGYNFGGWYKESGGAGGEFTSGTVVSSNITVYAKWVALSADEIFTYTINNSEITITGLTAEGKKLSSIAIPSKINGENVSVIGYRAFAGCKNLINITIPGSIISIDTRAFHSCSNLVNVFFSEGIKSIGELAFSYCTSLSNIVIPKSVTTMGHGVFNQCTGLTDVIIEDGVLCIGDSAFKSCDSLSSIIIPSSVISIGTAAFLECTNLSNVVISEGVTNIGDYSFASCPNLNSITIPDSVTYLGNQAFRDSGLKSIKIGNGVTRIDFFTFWNCSELTSVVLGDKVTTIEASAFSGCASLTCINIPDSVTSIGNAAFAKTGLTDIKIPDNVVSIGDSAFNGCSNLSSVNIPNSVTSLGEYAFKGTGLTNIIIGNGLTRLEYHVFAECTNLINVTIPDNITHIAWPFYGCTNLADITINDGNSNFCSVDGVVLSKNKHVLIIFPPGKSGNYEFPQSISSIDYKAFECCSKLTEIIIKNDIPPNATNSIENDFNGLSAIRVPLSAVDAYKTAEGWSAYADIIVGY